MNIRLRALITSLLALGLMLSVTLVAFAGSAEAAVGRKLVALTFDDGPGEYADDILDTTAQGLDALLTKLEERGFPMVTVEELLKERGITLEPGEIVLGAREESCARQFPDTSVLGGATLLQRLLVLGFPPAKVQ